MTHKFQPLDLTVNRSCKAFLRKKSEEWFSHENAKQINSGKLPEDVNVDVRISILKPLQAKWIVSFYDKMQSVRGIQIVNRGWDASGITAFLKKKESEGKEDPFL